MRDQRADDRRQALAALREHSKGDGNFPRTRPAKNVVREDPRDRGFELASPPQPERDRPLARRSSAAKRQALKKAGAKHTSPPAMTVGQAPKSSERSARKAAVEHRPQAGKRRTGTIKTAKPKTVVGSRAGQGT
jgi:hypothetical protein